MQKIFKHLFSETIWSLGYWGGKDASNIWIETRTDKKSTWYNLDLSKNSLNEIAQSENNSLQWFTGLKDGGVFLKLKQGKNPGIESLHCFNLPSGSQRYSINLSQWNVLDGEYLKCSAGIIDLKSGAICSTIPEQQFSWHIESPMHFEESQPEFKAFGNLFEQKYGEKIGKGLDYWEGSNKLIFSYYIYDNAWKNKLRICDHAFQTLFMDILAEGEQMGYHTFQCFENTLIYIKEKRELFIYEDL